MCVCMYVMATLSSLPTLLCLFSFNFSVSFICVERDCAKIIGLFCKKALSKRRYSATTRFISGPYTTTPPHTSLDYSSHTNAYSHTHYTHSLSHTHLRARARTHTHARTHACSLQQGGSGALVTSSDNDASIRSPFTSPPESPSKSAKVSTRIHMCVRVYMYVCLHIYVDIRGYI